VVPTALLLRSGDVVVMAERARACYHGLPRVRTERPLPPEVTQAAAAAADERVLAHMQQCRINISIRRTL
jgi:alkylated DNA repair protein alkB family protein 1